jgi:hypothetical protein
MMMQDRHKIPITILICDDDEDDRMLTQQALIDAHISNELQFVESPLFLTVQHRTGASTRIPWVHVDGVLEWTE